MTKEQLIDFLEWMNETAEHNPMILETDNEDIAEMCLSSIGYGEVDPTLPTTKPESLCEHHKGSSRAIIDGVEHWQCMKCKEWKV